MKRIAPLPSVLVALAIASACSNGDHVDATPSGDAGTTATLKPNVSIVPDDEWKDVTITRDAIFVPSEHRGLLAEVKPGAIIASGAGDGLLRRVVSVESVSGVSGTSVRPQDLSGTFTKIVTTLASLQDALQNASFDWTYSPAPDSANLGAKLTDNAAEVALDVVPTIAPHVQVSGQVTDGSISHLQLDVTTDLTIQLGERITFGGTKTWSGSKTLLDDHILYRDLKFIGPLPIVTVVHLSMDGLYSASLTAKADAKIGGSCTGTIGGTFEYDGGAWSANPVHTKSCQMDPPATNVEGRADADVHIAPKIWVTFDGIGGPTLTTSVGVKGGVQGCPKPSQWNVDAYTKASIGIAVSFFGFSTSYDKELDSADIPLGSGAIPTPQACACDVDAGESNCGKKCCTADQTCQDPSTSTCEKKCDSGAGETSCGTAACCTSTQTCTDAATGTCAKNCNTAAGETSCGASACCGSGYTCTDPANGTCTKTCSTGQVACGSVCCSNGCTDAGTCCTPAHSSPPNMLYCSAIGQVITSACCSGSATCNGILTCN